MKKNTPNPVKQADLNIQRKLQQLKPKQKFDVDTCLKWAPLIAFLAVDAFDKQSKNSKERHLIDAAVAGLLLNAATIPLKNVFRRQRPNGKPKSFPSNHTATSFLGSELLRQEIGEEHPVLSYAGYVASTVTAVLRLYHNKHWFSDVLAGAVLGVLSVKLAPVLMDKIIDSINIQPAV